MAAKKTTGTEMVKWEEALAVAAVEAVETTGKATNNIISIRGGVMKLNDEKIPDSTLPAVIADHIMVNAYYEGSFDPDNPTSPVCFAFGRKEEGMKPHEKSMKPQSEDCATCKNNEFGTGTKADGTASKGKACKNGRRLGLIAENALVQISKAEIAYINVPPTSIKVYDKYVKDVAGTLKRPPFGVVTTIKVSPDDKKNIEMHFDMKCKTEESKFMKDVEGMGAIFELNKRVAKEIDFAFERQAETEKPSTKDRKFTRPAAKKTAAKTARR